MQFYSTGILAKHIFNEFHFIFAIVPKKEAIFLNRVHLRRQREKSKLNTTFAMSEEILFLLPENPLRTHLEARLEVGVKLIRHWIN